MKAGKKASAITIESVQDQHAGIYTCLAENNAGQVRYSAQLDVNGTPFLSLALLDFCKTSLTLHVVLFNFQEIRQL